MNFVRGAFILLCMLPKNIVLGLSLRMSSSYGLIHDAVFLNCSLDGATWSNTSLRQWRVSPPLTLLFNGGNPTTSAAGYQEIISNVDTTGIFSLEITSLTWSHIGKQFECKYAFGTAVYTLTIAETEDYKNTILTQAEETIGLHIKGKITLDAIYPVPTVNATLITSSKTEDVKANALTNTTSAVSGNLKKVVINVDYVVSDAADYITVYLSTPGGYSKFSRFHTDVETTTAASTNGSDNGSELSGGEIAGIVIAVIVCGVVVCVIFIVIFKKKKNKGPILPCLKRLDDKDKEKLHNNCSEGPSDDNCSENEKGKHPWKSSVEPLNTSGDEKDTTKDETRNSPTSALSKSGVDVQILPSPSDTPRRLQPIATTVSVTNNQEEKTKNKKKKKKKKQAKQEQNQQQQEGKDNTGFDNDQRENIPSDDTGNLETKTTPSNKKHLPSYDTSYLETKTTPSNNDNLHSDDLGDPEMTTPNNIDSIPSDDLANPEMTTPNNNDYIPSDDPANLETKTTPSTNDNLHSDDLDDPETATPNNNDKTPSEDLGNKETTTPSNNHNIPNDDSGSPETTTSSNIDS